MQDKLSETQYQVNQLSKTVLGEQLDKLKTRLQEAEDEVQRIQQNSPKLDSDSECSGFSSCQQCLKSQLCGWCIMEQKCVRGDNIGPLNTICNFYDWGFCSGQRCGKLTDCASCLSDPVCGWCENSSKAYIKCLEQPPNFKGCPASGWYRAETNQPKCTSNQPPEVVEITDEKQTEAKRRAKKQPEEPLDRWRNKAWESNVIDSRAKALKDRQQKLQGLTNSELGQQLNQVFLYNFIIIQGQFKT